MMSRAPLIWGTVLFAAGITLSEYLPIAISLSLLLLCLAGCSLSWKRKGRIFLFFAIPTWLLLGCLRGGIPTHEYAFAKAIRQEGRQWNTQLTKQLQKSGLRGESLGMVSSLLLGNRSMLDRQTRKSFSQAGVSHLLALSGMHLGILYGILYFFIISAFRFSRWRWFLLPIILLAIWSFAILTGSPRSLVRASLMLSISTTIVFSSRYVMLKSPLSSRIMGLHILSLSALVMLIAEPENLHDIGFQLSFAAMYALTLVRQKTRIPSSKIPSNIAKWIVQIVCVSFVAQIGTLPITTYYFHSISLIAPFLNIVLIPITMLIIYASLPLLFFRLGWLADILTWMIETECRFIKASVQLPFTLIEGIYPPAWAVFLLYVLILTVVLRETERPEIPNRWKNQRVIDDSESRWNFYG